MKNTQKILLVLGIMALVGASSQTYAHCGACGSGQANHNHSEKEVEKSLAIYPLAQEAGFKTLTAAVEAAGLDAVLTEEGPFTVFAPTDEAFAKLPAGTVENLLANPEMLKKVLLYHVVSGSVSSAEVVKLTSAMTLNGNSVAIETKDGVTVNGAKVIKTDIGASNGTVHVIDTVLIPANM
jgi:uncharacterized surface protein with fasciclin (FAS1) repeats